jgi:hypothetical protein
MPYGVSQRSGVAGLSALQTTSAAHPLRMALLPRMTTTGSCPRNNTMALSL